MRANSRTVARRSFTRNCGGQFDFNDQRPADSLLPVDQRPTHARYVVMAFVCAICFLTYFDRVCICGAAADRSRSAHHRRADGSHFSAFWLAYALFEMPGGRMGQRLAPAARSPASCLSGRFSRRVRLGDWLLHIARLSISFAPARRAFPNIARVQSRWLPETPRRTCQRPALASHAMGRRPFAAPFWKAHSPVRFERLSLHDRRNRQSFIRWQTWRRGAGFLASGMVGLIWVVFFYPWFRDDPAKHTWVNEGPNSP